MVKEFIKGNFKTYKENFKKYLLTNIMILLITLILLIEKQVDFTLIIKIMLLTLSQFFTVELIIKNKKTKFIGYVISIVISIIFSQILKLQDSKLLTNLFYVYMISIPLIGIYKYLENEKIDFNKYITIISQNIIYTGIIFLILEAGINGIVLIIKDLLIPTIDYIVFEKIQILLIGIYLAPALIESLTNVNKKINEVLKELTKKLIMPLILIALVILYAYIIKIIVLRAFPKNIIFSLVCGIFAICFIIWTYVFSFNEKETLSYKISKKMPIIIIPLIVLQLYSLILRIRDYGITQDRYLGIIVLVSESIVIFLSIYKNRKYYSKIILVAVLMMLISFVIPKINMYNISNISQVNRLKKIWPSNVSYSQLSNDEKAQVNSIISYCKNNNIEDKISSYIEKIKQENSDLDSKTNTNINTNTNIYYSKEINETQNVLYLPDGYKSMKWGQILFDEPKTNEERLNFNKNGFTKEQLENAKSSIYDCKINIYDFIEQAIAIKENSNNGNELQDNINSYFENNSYIKTSDENIIFYVTYVNIYYTSKIPKISSIVINGYYFKK